MTFLPNFFKMSLFLTHKLRTKSCLIAMIKPIDQEGFWIAHTWLRYFPAKNVSYLSLLRKTGKAWDSGPFCHWGLEQFPNKELFLTSWLWGYWPVRMLLLLGQHSGVTVNFRKETRMVTEEDKRGTGEEKWARREQENVSCTLHSQVF